MLAQIIWSRLFMLHSDFRSLTLLHYSMLKSSCLCMTWFIKMARIKKRSSYPWWNNCASYFVPYFCSNSGCKMHTFTRTVSVNKIRAVYMGWRSNEKNIFFLRKRDFTVRKCPIVRQTYFRYKTLLLTTTVAGLHGRLSYLRKQRHITLSLKFANIKFV